jgi:hypothetical protein
MAKFSVKLPQGPLAELTTFFEEIHLNVVAPPTWAQPRNQWILAPTWVLINKRATLRQQGKLLQQAAHLIGSQITTGLKGDHGKQAAGVQKEAW